MNGVMKENEKEEWKYAEGREESVIDYVIGEDNREENKHGGGREVEADHHPIIVKIEKKKEGREGQKQGEKRRAGRGN